MDVRVRSKVKGQKNICIETHRKWVFWCEVTEYLNRRAWGCDGRSPPRSQRNILPGRWSKKRFTRKFGKIFKKLSLEKTEVKGQKNIFIENLIFDSRCRKKSFWSEKTSFFKNLTLEKRGVAKLTNQNYLFKNSLDWREGHMKKIKWVCLFLFVCLCHVKGTHFRGQKNIFHKNTKISIFTQIQGSLGYVLILWHHMVTFGALGTLPGLKKHFPWKHENIHFYTIPTSVGLNIHNLAT